MIVLGSVKELGFHVDFTFLSPNTMRTSLLVLEDDRRKAWLCLGLVSGFSDLCRSPSIRFYVKILHSTSILCEMPYLLQLFLSPRSALPPLPWMCWEPTQCTHALLLLLVDSFLVCFLQIHMLFNWFSVHTHTLLTQIIGAACEGYCQGPLFSSSWGCYLRVSLQIKHRSLFVFFDAVVWMILLC